jgi:putative FmdB family regulatory protein
LSGTYNAVTLHAEKRTLSLKLENQGARIKEADMPMYEYKCLDCGKETTLALSLKDHDSGAVSCPSCQSKRMEQLVSSVMAKTSRKS